MKLEWIIITLLITGPATSLFARGGSSQPSLRELTAAPDSVIIEGKTLVLQSYLWRDFMPNSPPNGKPLRAQIKIFPIMGDTCPPVQLSHLYFIYKGEIWCAKPERVSGNHRWIVAVAGGGPLWPPGKSVTVVALFRAANDKLHLLRVPRQIIHRTD